MEDKDMSSYIVNAMVAGGLAVWGAMASADIVST